MTYEEVFQKLKDLFLAADVSEFKGHLAYQFNITGEGEGIFYTELTDGSLHVEPYEYYDRDVIFTAKASTFIKIAEGKLDPVKAFTLGRLKVEGDFDKALKINNFLTK